MLRAARPISYSQRRSIRSHRHSPAHLSNRHPDVSGLRGEALRPRDFSHRRTDAKSLVSFRAGAGTGAVLTTATGHFELPSPEATAPANRIPGSFARVRALGFARMVVLLRCTGN